MTLEQAAKHAAEATDPDFPPPPPHIKESQSPRHAEQTQHHIVRRRKDAARLTDREVEVLSLLAEGLPNQEIADKLVISPATAKTHLSRTMTKLGARDRAQLVVLAYESGLVRPGWLA